MLQAGRDGGGSRSGATSRAGSFSEDESDDGAGAMGDAKAGLQRVRTNPDGSVRACADALGDHTEGSDDGGGLDGLEREEVRDKSLRGSVY